MSVSIQVSSYRVNLPKDLLGAIRAAGPYHMLMVADVKMREGVRLGPSDGYRFSKT